MQIKRTAKDTLTAVEMLHDDVLHFQRLDGSTVAIELKETGAEIVSTTLKTPGAPEPGGMTTYRFWGDFLIDGNPIRMEREIGTQKSFSRQPWETAGVRIWLDAVDGIFAFMRETHGPCRPSICPAPGDHPRRHARLALQDASARICPERVQPWCPLPQNGLRIEDCYRGEDCWLGAYDGADAHGGLDINHPSGTPLYVPINLDDQFLYNSVEMGHNNNRWHGIRHWPNGATWILTSCHMNHLTVPEHQPLEAGTQYADGAGVCVGAAEHSHFGFAVFDYGYLIRLDPWILFQQMYRDGPR